MNKVKFTIKHYMKVKGSKSYGATQRAHHILRENMSTLLGITRMEKWITIKEYCAFVGVSEQEVQNCLNSK